MCALSRCWFLLLLGVVLASSSSAWADRRDGLAGDRLIEDRNDVFLYPQRLLDYRNLIRLGYGNVENLGSGLLIVGSDRLCFGLSVHRGDLLAPDLIGTNSALSWIDPLENPLVDIDGEPGFIDTNPKTMFDVLFAMRLGPGKVGARLGFGGDLVAETPALVGETSASQTFFFGELGYSFGKKIKIDSSFNMLVNFGSQVSLGAETTTAESIRFALSNRVFWPVSKIMTLGLFIDGSYQAQSRELPLETLVHAGDRFGILAGIGPVFNVNEGTRISGYLVVGYDIASIDPDDSASNDQRSERSFLAPGFHMAFETALVSWFFVRTGIQYDYRFNTSFFEVEGGEDAFNDRLSDFGWSVGLGVKLPTHSEGDADTEYFFADAAFRSAFLTASEKRGLFGVVSAGYQF